MTANNEDLYEPSAKRLESDVGEAFHILQKAMLKDPSYAYGWHANIAMALFDSMPQTFWMPDKSQWHDICNDAATEFMIRAFQVQTSNDMLLNKDSTPDIPKGPKRVQN